MPSPIREAVILTRLAGLFAISRQRIFKLAEEPDFPKPIVQHDAVFSVGKQKYRASMSEVLYDREEVVAWMTARRKMYAAYSKTAASGPAAS